MQFKVPQFLDIEDKIFGELTFSQFAYLAGGAGLSFVLYKALGFLIGAIPILLVVAFSLALAFYKPNSKPFIHMLEASIKYASQSKLYIWKKSTAKKSTAEMQRIKKDTSPEIEDISHHLTKSKLKDLSWSLDVLDLKR